MSSADTEKAANNVDDPALAGARFQVGDTVQAVGSVVRVDEDQVTILFGSGSRKAFKIDSDALTLIDRKPAVETPPEPPAALLRARRGPERGPHLLSPREREIYNLIADGLTSHSIGERLGISARTVEDYRYRIRRKLDYPPLVHLKLERL